MRAKRSLHLRSFPLVLTFFFILFLSPLVYPLTLVDVIPPYFPVVLSHSVSSFSHSVFFFSFTQPFHHITRHLKEAQYNSIEISTTVIVSQA